MGVDSKMSVCVCVCVSVTTLSPIIFWTYGPIGTKKNYTKTRENVYLGFLILGFRGHRPRVKALG